MHPPGMAEALRCPLCNLPGLVFAAGVCEQHACLLHVETLVVGRVKKVHAPGEYVGENGRAVTAFVLELSTGDAFVLKSGELGSGFVPLSEEELALFERLVGTIATTIATTVRSVPPPADPESAETARLLVRASLVVSLRRLAPAG